MSSSKRKSTVHDFSSLRLHPDGTRVGSSHANHSLRNARYAVQDHRGNWIARDAGGLGRVQKRWSSRVADNSAMEGDGTVDDGVVIPPQSDKWKGKARETSVEAVTTANDDEVKDPRALRRRLFADDLSFIRPPPTVNTAAGIGSSVVEDSVLGLPDASLYPSSDLLKCIHYFASTYYSEMGQLRDSTREYRKEKKRRRVERLKAEETSLRASTSRESSLDASPSKRSSLELDEPVEHHEGSSHEKAASGKNTKQRQSRDIKRDTTNIGTDMYKLFDGSALMAIGMLLQEYVSEQVSGQIPEGWEDEMLRAQGLDAQGMTTRKRKGRQARKPKRRDSEEEAVSTEYEEEDNTDAPMSILSDGNETHGESLPE